MPARLLEVVEWRETLYYIQVLNSAPPRAEPQNLTGVEAGGPLPGSSVLAWRAVANSPWGKAQKLPQRQQARVGAADGKGEVAS